MNKSLGRALFGALVALLVSAAPLASQTGAVLVVDAGGGAAFTQIQAAVAAADDGDTILVRGGNYAPVSVVGKGLALVGEPGTTVTVFGGIELRDTAPGQALVLVNLDALGSHTQGSERALTAVGLGGALRVQGCTFTGALGMAYTPPLEHGGHAVALDAVSAASFSDCLLLGGNGAQSFTGFEVNRGGDALAAVDAIVSLHDTTLRGGNGGPGEFAFCDFGGAAGGGARLTGASSVFASGSIAVGGNGGGDDLFACNPGGDGLRLDAATTHATLLDNLLLGGTGACGMPAGEPVSSEAGASTFTIAGQARGLDVASPLHELSNASFEFTGEPGDSVHVLVATQPLQQFLPKFQGVLHTGLPLLLPPLGFGVIPAQGTLAVDVSVPALPPGLDALWLSVQPLLVESQGALWLGEPATLVVLDASL